MKDSGFSLRKAFLILLVFVGMTLVVLLCTYGIIKFFHAADAKEDAVWLGFLCAITTFLFYPGAIILGILTFSLSSGIADQDLRYKWLLMLVLSSAIFVLGYLLFSGNAELVPVPGFLRPVFDVYVSLAECAGMYFMLYGGIIILLLFYTGQRVTIPIAIVKLFLQLATVHGFASLCIDHAFNGRDDGLLSLVFILGLIFAVILSGMLGFKLSNIFAHNVEGNMSPFFWLMYTLAGIMGVLGVALVLGNLFLGDIVYDFLTMCLPFVPSEWFYGLEGIHGFLMGLVYAGTSFLWLLSTYNVQEERCPRCGGYAHENVTSLGVISSFVSGEYIVTRSELTKVELYYNGMHRDHYDDYEDKYKRVTYTNEEAVECRYCGRDFGTRTYQETRNEKEETYNQGSHREWHWM